MNQEDKEELLQLRAEVSALRLAVQDKLSSDDMSWLQMKVARQRQQLNHLNLKVATQRFRLRTLNEMGRDLTHDEYVEARNKIENEQLKERVSEHYIPLEKVFA